MKELQINSLFFTFFSHNFSMLSHHALVDQSFYWGAIKRRRRRRRRIRNNLPNRKMLWGGKVDERKELDPN